MNHIGRLSPSFGAGGFEDGAFDRRAANARALVESSALATATCTTSYLRALPTGAPDASARSMSFCMVSSAWERDAALHRHSGRKVHCALIVPSSLVLRMTGRFRSAFNGEPPVEKTAPPERNRHRASVLSSGFVASAGPWGLESSPPSNPPSKMLDGASVDAGGRTAQFASPLPRSARALHASPAPKASNGAGRRRRYRFHALCWRVRPWECMCVWLNVRWQANC